MTETEQTMENTMEHTMEHTIKHTMAHTMEDTMEHTMEHTLEHTMELSTARPISGDSSDFSTMSQINMSREHQIYEKFSSCTYLIIIIIIF